MIPQLWCALQALVEYGAANGGATAQVSGPKTRFMPWVIEHQVILAVAAAGILLIWFMRSAYRR